MPPHFHCNGRRHEIRPGLYRFTVEVNGVAWTYKGTRGSCHDAAYLAQRVALLLARRAGLTSPVIRNGNPLVTNQMNRVWQARRPATGRHRALCRVASAGMRPVYI